MAPGYRRADIKGGAYFFTVNTFRRQPILTTPALRRCLREAIVRARQTHPFRIDAWVLLPDHLHCLWTLPPGDGDFSSRWGFIKRFVSQRCQDLPCGAPEGLNPSRRKRKETGLWQRRFWEHAIRDPEDFNRHVDYIHWNPVKHGHVRRVVEWPYSTFHRYASRGVYSPDWGGGDAANFDVADFGELPPDP
jgi:putative transposase